MDELKFGQIRDLGGSQNEGFEEFCCHLARRHSERPRGGTFTRLRGAGGDGGVECYWGDVKGSEWGLQAKYVFDIDALRTQATESFKTALEIHPKLDRYTLCFPFNPTGPTSRRGTSEKEKLDSMCERWAALAKELGRVVVIDLWGESTLRDLFLEIDSHGGRHRFWFGERMLSDDWFDQHLRSARAYAGPRYNGELNIDHPVSRCIEALGHTHAFRSAVEERSNGLADAVKAFERGVEATRSAGGDVPEETDTIVENIQAVVDSLLAWTLEPSPTQVDLILESAQDVLGYVERLEQDLADDLIAKYGDEWGGSSVLTSQPFRQFRASYQLDFPAAAYDNAITLQERLRDDYSWLLSPNCRAASSRVLLITGDAGVGKTHSLVDAAFSRNDRGLRTILLFGGRFQSPRSLWLAIAAQIGLGSLSSESELLDMLDAAGEASGSPLLLMFDALNESSPRTWWRQHLGPLIEALGSYPHLRIVLSCRSGYVDLTIPRSLAAARYNHVGFLDDRWTAVVAFFRHADILPPVTPFLPPEFGNPLFLRLLCDTINNRGFAEVPPGWNGVSVVFRELLDAKNEKFSYDFDRALATSVVDRVLVDIATELSEQQRTTLPLNIVRRICHEHLGGSQHDLVEWLVGENLLYHDREVRFVDDAFGDSEDVVGIAFERLRDYLVARALRSACSVDSKGGAHFSDEVLSMVGNRAGLLRHYGVVEFLSILLPETLGVELIDFPINEAAVNDVLKLTVRNLQWRDSNFFTDRTAELLSAALESDRVHLKASAFGAALALTLKPSMLDAWFFSRYLFELSMSERDGYWCPFAHFQFESGGEVNTLLEIPEGIDTQRIPFTTRERWVCVLTWMFAAPDRRVRDRALRTSVVLAQDAPATWLKIIERFRFIDDDYILERLLCAVYGTCLRRRSAPEVQEIANLICSLFFEDIAQLPVHVVIRDLARSIVELAASGEQTATSCLPPYQSQWPPNDAEWWYDEPESDAGKWGLNQVYHSCLQDDFFTYILSDTDRFDSGFDRSKLAEWIIAEVRRLGYGTEAHGRYDEHIVHTQGGGRGRADWAERLGKKYQWIALNRLLGRLADNVGCDELSYYEPPPPDALQGQHRRDIDPGLIIGTPDDAPPEAWSNIRYPFEEWLSCDDEEWLAKACDLLAIEDRLLQPSVRGEAADDWLMLEGLPRWFDRDERSHDRGFRRAVWINVSSFLVPQCGFDRTWKWLRDRTIDEEPLPDYGYTIHKNIFIGEYPWASAFKTSVYAAMEPNVESWPVEVLPTCHTLGGEFLEDCSLVNGSTRVTVPIPRLLGRLEWDGAGGYAAVGESPQFLDPSFAVGGFSACLVHRETLAEYLAKTQMIVVWIIRAEKLPGSYEDIGRSNFRHVICFDPRSKAIRRARQHELQRERVLPRWVTDMYDFEPSSPKAVGPTLLSINKELDTSMKQGQIADLNKLIRRVDWRRLHFSIRLTILRLIMSVHPQLSGWSRAVNAVRESLRADGMDEEEVAARMRGIVADGT